MIFGTSTYYSVIDFGMALWNESLTNVMKTLANDFGIDIENNLSVEELAILRKKQEKYAREREKKEEWFKAAFISLTDLYHKTKNIIKDSNIDELSPSICSLDNKLERILDVDENNKIAGSFILSSKEELYSRYKDLDFTNKNNICECVDIIFDDLVRRDFHLNSCKEEIETEEEAI